MQQQPNYILQFEDSQSITIDNGGIWGIIQKICLCMILILVIASLLLRENLFGEMTGYTIAGFVVIWILCSMKKKTKWVTFPIEIRFYNDCLIVIRDHVPYDNGKKSRMEWDQMMYDDVKLVRWRLKAKRVMIEGKVHGIWTWYDENGNLTERKKYDKVTDSAIIFDTHNMGDIDLAKEFETHSPLKVEVANT